MSRRRRRRRHRGAVWLAGIVLLACWQIASPLRWVVLGGSAMGLAIVPLALAGGLHALPQLLTPREVRAARRGPRIDPATGLEVRPARPAIPAWLRRAVYAADRYRCVYCRSKAGIQFDHIVPWSYGGLSSLWNGATLCAKCNRVKSDYHKINGRIYYRPWRDAADQHQAEAILRAEILARYSPLRWVRAGCTWWIPRQGR